MGSRPPRRRRGPWQPLWEPLPTGPAEESLRQIASEEGVSKNTVARALSSVHLSQNGTNEHDIPAPAPKVAAPPNCHGKLSQNVTQMGSLQRHS
ncbi:MAG: hypothetical protein AMXMBFR33_41300 [Candidatus Xenobia bacterium]